MICFECAFIVFYLALAFRFLDIRLIGKWIGRMTECDRRVQSDLDIRLDV